MKAVVLDADLRAKLGGGAAKVTLTDEAGKPVGHYLPEDLYRGLCNLLIPPEANARAAAREELHRGEGVTTAEMLVQMQEKLRRWSGGE